MSERPVPTEMPSEHDQMVAEKIMMENYGGQFNSPLDQPPLGNETTSG